MTVEVYLQNRVDGNESTTDLESTDTGQKPNERASKKLSPAVIQSRKFASSDFKFLKLEDLVISGSVIEPISYQLQPGSILSDIYVNDKRRLLMEQRRTGGESKVSAIVALRKHRVEKLPRILNTEPQIPLSCCRTKYSSYSTKKRESCAPFKELISLTEDADLKAAQQNKRSISSSPVLRRR